MRLHSKNKAERRKAAFELGRLKLPVAVEPLMNFLDDDNANTRATAALELGQIGDERALYPLLKKITDKSTPVRACVIEALGNIGDTTVIPPLKNTFINDTDKDVHKAAKAALTTLGQGVFVNAYEKYLRNKGIGSADD